MPLNNDDIQALSRLPDHLREFRNAETVLALLEDPDRGVGTLTLEMHANNAQGGRTGSTYVSGALAAMVRERLPDLLKEVRTRLQAQEKATRRAALDAVVNLVGGS